MKNYRITLDGDRYTLPVALTAADRTWNVDLGIHTCNGTTGSKYYQLAVV